MYVRFHNSFPRRIKHQQQREKEKIPGEGADADSNQFLTSIQLPYAMKIIIIEIGMYANYLPVLFFTYSAYLWTPTVRMTDD